MANATTNKKPTAANTRSDEMVTLTSRNGHGIARSVNTIPAYAIEAARRVSPSSMVVHGD